MTSLESTFLCGQCPSKEIVKNFLGDVCDGLDIVLKGRVVAQLRDSSQSSKLGRDM